MHEIRLTPQLIQTVRDTVDIVDIAADLTSLKRRGRKHEGLCPFHKEKTPSFHVDPDIGVYHCFGCGVGGDAIDLFMRHSGDDFPGAIEALAQRYAIPVERAQASSGPHRPDPSSALAAAQEFFTQGLAKSPFATKYLEDRQIPRELWRKFGLGYAPDGWHHLLDALRRKHDPEILLETGLIGRSDRTDSLYDRFRHRLMFPIHNGSGRLVGFGGRTLGDDRAKYVNTSETEFFHKGRLVYGLHQAKRSIRDQSCAILVEGYFDVIGAVASGVENAVACMGTALTPEQGTLLARHGDEVILAYDGDEAGNKAVGRALPILLTAGLRVRRAAFPPGHDPDSLRLEQGEEAVRATIDAAADAVLTEVERLIPDQAALDPMAQSQAAESIRTLLQPIRDRVTHESYSRLAARQLEVPEGVMLRKGGARSFGKMSEQKDVTRSGEEQVLALLLTSGVNIPPLEELPPKEVFLDPQCRNIFTAFCDLYKTGQSAPTNREVISRLADEGMAVDRAAKLLLEEAVPEEISGLADALGRLQSRWLKRRLGEIVQEIRQAQQRGDQTHLEQLLEEKTRLSRQSHPGTTGRLWSQRP